jgi:hypothetical protein
MRTYQKAGAALAAVGLAASLAACSSSGGSSKPVGQFKTLTGNATSVKLAPAFLSTLTTLKLMPGVLGTAKLDATTGVVSFPITGGNATIYKKGSVNPYVQGAIDHQGSGLSLTAGSKSVMLENFVVHPGKNSNLTGDVGVGGQTMKNVKLFDLDGSTLKTPTISSAGVATLTGTTVYLDPGAAKALDGVFGVKALEQATSGGKKVDVGIATIKATGK